MEEEQTYSLVKVSLPVTEGHVEQYSAIRLLGLQIDPLAFGSTFARESQFTREQWRDRLQTPGRVTLGVSPHDSGPWLGTASILTPEMLEAVGYVPPEEFVLGGAAVYMLVGMWVHPDHRRKGLARRLIEMGCEVVRDDDGGQKTRRILLQVHRSNQGAKLLYDNLGFLDGPLDSGSDEVWMWREVNCRT